MYRRDQQARYGKTQWTPLAPLTPDAGLFCAVILRAVQPAVVLPRWVCRASQLGKPDGRDLAPAPLWRGLLFVAPLSGGRPGRVWGGLARQRWGVGGPLDQG